MAHTTQKNINGVLTDVVEFDNSAQAIDDAVFRTKHYAAPNLADNWDLRSGVVINQKGKTEYTGVGYGIDRWKITSGAASVVSPDANGTTVNISVAWALFSQAIDNFSRFIGKPLTLTLLTGGVVSSGYQLVLRQSANSYKTVLIDRPNSLYSVSLPITDEADQITIGVQARSASPGFIQLAAFKLEIGDNQTLAYQDANGNWVLTQYADPAEQLWKCQRYYQLFSSESKRPTSPYDYRPAMRSAFPATGTIEIDGLGGGTLYYADANL